jgi:hypothetical protein
MTPTASHARAEAEFRRLAAALAFTLTSLALRDAAADPNEDAKRCIASAERAQLLRNASQLRAARQELLVCARPDCPAPVHRDCAEWLRAVEGEEPSLVFHAADARGRAITGVTVVDGDQPLSVGPDGAPIWLDPGVHLLTFRAPWGATLEARITLSPAEMRRLELRFPESPRAGGGGADESQAAPAPSGPPLSAWIAGGIGVAALGSFAVFEATGLTAYHSLRSGCGVTHSCAQSDVDAAQSKIIAAGVSLGVSVVALGAATWLFLAPRPPEPSSAGPVSLSVQIRPEIGGASGRVGIRF